MRYEAIADSTNPPLLPDAGAMGYSQITVVGQFPIVLPNRQDCPLPDEEWVFQVHETEA